MDGPSFLVALILMFLAAIGMLSSFLLACAAMVRGEQPMRLTVTALGLPPFIALLVGLLWRWL
jgi:hypothetical protein